MHITIYLHLSSSLSTSSHAIVTFPPTVTQSPASAPILIIVIVIVIATHCRFPSFSYSRTLPFNVCSVSGVIECIIPKRVLEILQGLIVQITGWQRIDVNHGKGKEGCGVWGWTAPDNFVWILDKLLAKLCMFRWCRKEHSAWTETLQVSVVHLDWKTNYRKRTRASWIVLSSLCI